MTRFALWPRWAAGLVLLLTASLVLAAALPRPPLRTASYGPGGYTDLMLYRDVVARVAKGQDYYAAAAAEQRAHSYPTAPAQVFREPTLAWLLALLRVEPLRAGAFWLLVGLTVVSLQEAYDRAGIGFRARLALIAAHATGLGFSAVASIDYLHEAWAALLITLSLSRYRPVAWRLSLALGMAACLMRELAIGYLCAMAAFAVGERRWREALAWLGGVALFGGLFALHLIRASGFHHLGDKVSSGWFCFGGLPFVISTARWNLLLALAPAPVVAAAICLGLIGLVGWKDGRTGRAALIVGGYLAAFAVVGQSIDWYWGILYAPLLPVGCLLAPAALRDLWARTFRRHPA